MPSREEKQRRKALRPKKTLQRNRSDDGNWPASVTSQKEQIESPLWNLILSTNNCYPGCSCDDDVFEMTPQRVQSSIDANELNVVKRAVSQMDELLRSNIDVSGFSYQINLWMETKEEVVQWLEEWKALLQSALEENSAM